MICKRARYANALYLFSPKERSIGIVNAIAPKFFIDRRSHSLCGCDRAFCRGAIA
ncbi:MAG: hypothetical protein WBV73_10290 [Phormidium sp.]